MIVRGMEGRDGLVKRENIPAFIMALLSVAVLALVMCDAALRFVTKNIVYDKMNVDSKTVLWIVDGLVLSQEGTAAVIDWNEQYPRKQQPAVGGEDRQGGAAGAWAAFDRKMRGAIGKYKQIMEYYCTDGLRNQSEIAELAAGYDNLIGWQLVMGDGALRVNENGFLGSINAERIETEEIAESVAGLNELVVSEGGLFCYVQIPGNVCKYEEEAVGIYADYANENADRLLEQLAREGVPYLDLREELHAAGMEHREAFYRTDCHWKVPTAFWATGVIAEYLTQIGEIRFDSDQFDAGRYRTILYENSFLGGNGRALTLKKAEPEDFELMLPDYKTAFQMEIPSRQMVLEGDFEEVFIFDAPLTSRDYYGEDPYDSYRTRNYPLIRIHNQGVENNQGKRLLIIRDSFSAPLIPYLATDIEYMDCLFLQSFQGSVREYIRQTHPDIVLVAYYPPNIQKINWNSDSSTFDFR